MVIATNFTSICCFYKEKIVKNGSNQIQKVATFDSDRKKKSI